MSALVRTALLVSTAFAAIAPVHAAATAGDQYLPRDILVTGQRIDGYQSTDGSSATKTDTPLIDVPQSVYVLTEEQLEDQAVRTLGDALRYAPGVSLESGEGHRDEVFIRGQETTADFYIDGLRDDAQYYRPLYNIDRIEVLKGANALIFGRGGGGGVINRVTKTANPLDAFGQVDASVDTFGGFAVSGDINQPLGDNVGVRLNATYEDLANNRDVFEGRFFGISPTLTAFVGPDTNLTASYTYDDDDRVTDRGIPALNGRPIEGYDDVFFGDPDYNRANTQVHIARARLAHAFSQSLSANASVQYADYDKFYGNIVPTGTNGTTVGLSGYESATQRENLIGQLNFIGTFETGSIGHKVLVGGEVIDTDTASTRDRVLFGGTTGAVQVPLAQTIAVPAFTLTPQRASATELTVTSAYIQDQVSIGDHLELVAGIRFEEFALDAVDTVTSVATSRTDTLWSPRFGVIVKPVERISLYASYTESFLPQSGDQFTSLSQQDATLEPERFENIEAGAKWAIRPDLFATAAVFRLTRSNTPAVDPNDPTLTVLTGESEVTGFELSLAGQIAPRLQANLAYTYLDGEVTKDSDFADAGQRLQQLPESQVAAWARYDVLPTVGIGAGVIHQSEQLASFSGNVTLPGYTRVDAAVFWDITDALSLQVNVENLFDVDYYPSAHGDNNIAPGAPLNAAATIRAKF